uniref:Transmembrane protein 100 n=1 Tax=Seriola dumerili TaxID=41447 RepID=A0A3B4TS59_SERDU
HSHYPLLKAKNTHSNLPYANKPLCYTERLAQATGGTEKSWYRCVFPFGVISLVIGMAGTGVTFTFNTLLQTKVVSVALLCTGILMLLVAAVCWRAHRLRKKKKKEGGFFTADQGTFALFVQCRLLK